MKQSMMMVHEPTRQYEGMADCIVFPMDIESSASCKSGRVATTSSCVLNEPSCSRDPHVRGHLRGNVFIRNFGVSRARGVRNDFVSSDIESLNMRGIAYERGLQISFHCASKSNNSSQECTVPLA